MFTDPKIAPSILSADFANLQREIEAIEQGGAAYIHFDTIDAHFAPNLTIGVPVLKSVKRIARIPIDLHLMIDNPLETLPWYLELAPDMVTVHIEALDAEKGQVEQAIAMIHEAGSQACLACKPDYDVDGLAPYLSSVDMVLVMSVFPGFSGQKYIEGSDARVARVAELARAAGAAPLIEVDGGMGVNAHTELCVAAGADVLVAGSAVYGKGNPADNIQAMLALARSAQQGRR